MTRMRRSTGVVLGAGVLAAVLAGCGGSSQQPSSQATVAGTSSTSPSAGVSPGAGASTATAAVCADANALRASMDRLRTAASGGGPTGASGGASALTGELATMQTQLQRLVTDAKGAYGPQVQAVQTKAAALGSTLHSAGASPTPGTASAVTTAFRQLGVAVDDLVHSVTQGC